MATPDTNKQAVDKILSALSEPSIDGELNELIKGTDKARLFPQK
jgi:hypothetical protein